MTVYIAGTFDTKASELLFVQQLLHKQGLETCLVDLSTGGRAPSQPVDVSAQTVANCHQGGSTAVFTGDRGTAIVGMADAFSAYLGSQANVAAVIGLGGSGGTAVVGPAFQNLPIGIPKIIVSTMASGNIAPYVGASDICMMYSVTDIGGLNSVLERVLTNAAHALVGMLEHEHKSQSNSAPSIGMTMFGVTTPCVEALRTSLEPEYAGVIFHATGTGGNSMEKLVENGFLTGVIDATTTEVADHLMGGVLSAGPGRMDIFAQMAIPYVGSCGAVDMVNFGSPDSVPARYKDRLFYQHNPHITLMRTTAEENARIGEWIGQKLTHFKGPTRFLIPENGFSALDAPDQAFYDPEARAAFTAALTSAVKTCKHIEVTCLPHHINDAAFALALKENFLELYGDN
ncbi:MAG: Tm-1-like ATP-binding domain-containing protein [Kordiimonadaceae bacterium]|nr:Tm-1-like ATP-binding domain-containing protein [Kordiimonadaceae bacterium]